MDGPLPSWLVGRAANGQASEVNDFELAFFKRAGFVRSFESLQHYFEWGHRSASLPMFGVGARFAGSAWGPSARLVSGLLHDFGVRGQGQQREVLTVEVVHQV